MDKENGKYTETEEGRGSFSRNLSPAGGNSCSVRRVRVATRD